MNNQEALNTLNDIRNMMEKSTRFVSFSGLSSIVIGIYACIAAIIAYSILGNTTPVPRLDVDTPAKLQLLIVFASLLIIVCIVTVILMCRHKAHQNNQSLLFDFNTKRLLWNFFLPLVVGGILCISLIWQSHYGLTSSIMLIFYGVALISASNYTFSNTRYLGYAEIALGLADSFVENYALLFWVVGFGQNNRPLSYRLRYLFSFEIRKKEQMKLNLEDINKAFESKARLGIMSVLLVNESIDFVSLKNLLELTDGNLASHTRNLEELGYIRSYKQFIGRKPNTTFSVTPEGKEAFKKHLNALENFLKKQLE